MRYPALIMDSGATFLYNKYVKKSTKGSPGTYIKDKRNIDFSFYKTDIFKDFRDSYIKFCLKSGKHLLGYVNMDVINHAEASYKSLKFMESRGCRPLPVFHLGNDEKWLKRYVKEGYKYICIGGITPNPYTTLKPVMDRIWRDILTNADGMPVVKVHGLACTAYKLLIRYPWYSVDSATWTKLGAWGGIYVPRKDRKTGEFSFNRRPFGIQVSERSSKIGVEGAHLFTVEGKHKTHIKEWLQKIKVPLGRKGVINEPGVINDYECRMKANLFFYQALFDSLPKWPWAFDAPLRRGLLDGEPWSSNLEAIHIKKSEQTTPLPLYSGSRSKCVSPEDLLVGRTAGYMLTYSDFYNKKSSEAIRRFQAHLERAKHKKEK